MPFSRTFQAWKSQHFNSRTFQDFPGSVRTLEVSWVRIVWLPISDGIIKVKLDIQGHLDLHRQIPSTLNGVNPHWPLNAADRFVVARKSIELCSSRALFISVYTTNNATFVSPTFHRHTSQNRNENENFSTQQQTFVVIYKLWQLSTLEVAIVVSRAVQILNDNQRRQLSRVTNAESSIFAVSENGFKRRLRKLHTERRTAVAW